MFVLGRHIAQDAAESAITTTRYYTCPWGQARRAAGLLPLRRAVVDGHCSLTEYIGGRPSIAALEALAIVDAEVGVATRALNKRKTT